MLCTQSSFDINTSTSNKKVYSSTSLVRGFWDEIFWPSKPRTTEEPRTKEGHIKVDIGTKFLLQQVIWWS